MVVYGRLGEAAADDQIVRRRLRTRLPVETEIIDRYTAGSPRDLPGSASTSALASFKLAAILEGIHYRYLRMARPWVTGFAHIGDAVHSLLDTPAPHDGLKEYG